MAGSPCRPWGFCLPRFRTTSPAGLAAKPEPSPDPAREGISGNLCRCTGYQNIVTAVRLAADRLAAKPHA